MKTNISKSQLEVWEWKASLSMEINNLPPNKRLDFLVNKHKKTVDAIKKRKEILYKNKLKDNNLIIADSIE